MAKIPDQWSVGAPSFRSVSGTINVDGKAAAAPGQSQAEIGRAVGGLGKALGGLIEAAGQGDEQAEKYRVATEFATLDQQIENDIKERERNIAPDGSGHQQGVTDYVDGQFREFFQKVPERLRPEYDLKMRRRATDFEGRARDREYTQRDTYEINDLNQRSQAVFSGIEAEPEKTAELIGRQIFVIENSRLPTNRKQEAIRKFGEAAEAHYAKTRRDAIAKIEDPEERLKAYEELDLDIEKRVRPTWDFEPAAGRVQGPPRQFNPAVETAIAKASQETGVDVGLLRTVAQIESSGNPSTQTGSYKGLFQLSDEQFRQYGAGGDIFDPEANARAGAAKIADLASKFEKTVGRPATATDIYLMHQQGEGGYPAHLANPDQLAWRTMAGTAEGRQKGEEWAKRAIWGNVPSDVRSKYNVETMTSRDFVEMWDEKVRRIGGSSSKSVGGGPRPEKPNEFLRMKLAKGYESRTGDVDNLKPVVQDRLAAFLAAAEDAGHDIRVISGYRDDARQAQLWQNALRKYGSAAEARKWVAPPGGSTHQSGEAIDLQYGDRGAGLGGKRTAAVAWAHANAKKFGMHFPLDHEDWHIEPVEARAGGRRYGGQYGKAEPMYRGGGERPQLAEQASRPVSERGITSFAGLRTASRTDVATDASAPAPQVGGIKADDVDGEVDVDVAPQPGTEPLATANSPTQMATFLDGIPDSTPLSEIPEEQRNRVLELLPPQDRERFTKPIKVADGVSTSGEAQVTVGDIKRPLQEALRQTQRAANDNPSPEARLVPADYKPKYQFRYLTQRQVDALRRDNDVARRDMFLSMFPDKLDPTTSTGETRYVIEYGEERRGRDGRTMLERAQGVLTPNQYNRAKRIIETAKDIHRYVTPMWDQPEMEIRNYQRDLATNRSDDAFTAQKKTAVRVYADKQFEKVRELRRDDRAAAADMTREVREAQAMIEDIKADVVSSVDENGRPVFIQDQAQVAKAVARSNEIRFAARIKAQERIFGVRDGMDFEGVMPEIKILTKADVENLLGVSPAQWAKLYEQEKDAHIQRAAARAEAWYGKYALRAFKEAIRYTDKESREVDDRVLNRLERSSQRNSSGVNMSTMPAPRIDPRALEGLRWAQQFANPDLYAQPNQRADLIAPSRGQPTQPTRAAIEWLMQDPANRMAAFERRFPGASAAFNLPVPQSAAPKSAPKPAQPTAPQEPWYIRNAPSRWFGIQ